jgi:hypothetical protein
MMLSQQAGPGVLAVLIYKFTSVLQVTAKGKTTTKTF